MAMSNYFQGCECILKTVTDTVIIGWLRGPLGLMQQVCVWCGGGGAGGQKSGTGRQGL